MSPQFFFHHHSRSNLAVPLRVHYNAFYVTVPTNLRDILGLCESAQRCRLRYQANLRWQLLELMHEQENIYQFVGSKALGSAQEENDYREESRRTLLHATGVLDTGCEEEFDW